MTAATPPARVASRPLGGRTFPTMTNLGKIMEHRGYTATEVSQGAAIHPRTLTEYLAGRVAIRAHHIQPLAMFLKVPADYLK